MDSEAKAEALEAYLSKELDAQTAGGRPTAAELEEKDRDEDVSARRRAAVFSWRFNSDGRALAWRGRDGQAFAENADKPTLMDSFRLRFAPAAHALQSVKHSGGCLLQFKQPQGTATFAAPVGESSGDARILRRV